MPKAQMAPSKNNKNEKRHERTSPAKHEKNERKTERHSKNEKGATREQEEQTQRHSKRDRKQEKAQKQEKTQKQEEQTEAAPTQEEVSVQEQSVRDQLNTEYQSVKQAGKDLLDQFNKFRKLVETYHRATATATGALERDNKKLRGKRRNRSNSKAIQRPFPMSNSLCEFLGMEHGSELPRTEVTKKLCAYASEHCTRSKTNKGYFSPDAKMAKLLGTKKGETVHYIMGLQSRIKAQRLFLPVEKKTSQSTEESK